jgi:8-oxo-dGTP pyrophosphatase MutT (NUDIX family)
VPKIAHGASACLIDAENRVLLIAREKEPFRDRREPVPRGDALAFPGGSIEDGESALAAAQRELTEETGYIATGDPIAHVVVENVSGEKSFRIESFAFTKWIAPKNGGELASEWMTFERALNSKLAPGMQEALKIFQRAIANHPKK